MSYDLSKRYPGPLAARSEAVYLKERYGAALERERVLLEKIDALTAELAEARAARNRFGALDESDDSWVYAPDAG